MLPWVAPFPFVVWVNRTYFPAVTVEQVEADMEVKLATIGGEREDISQAAKDLFESESARVERLEDKLARFGDFLAVLLPLIVALTVAAFARAAWWSFGLALAAVAYLGFAYLAALVGSATYRFHTPATNDVLVDLTHPVAQRRRVRAARLLAMADGNVPRGNAINNLISGVQHSLLIAVMLASASAALLAYDLPVASDAPRQGNPVTNSRESAAVGDLRVMGDRSPQSGRRPVALAHDGLLGNE